jgi:hypothetical protein
VTIGDILIYGGCGFFWLFGMGWFIWHRLYPRQAQAMHHLSAIGEALKRGLPDAARAAYATLRELALHTPEVAAVRDIQLMGMYTLLYHWIGLPRADHADVALCDEDAALADQMWTDLCAIAAASALRPQTSHMMVRVLSPLVRVCMGADRARAAAALQLMERFYRHCAQCTDTFSADVYILGKRLGVG